MLAGTPAWLLALAGPGLAAAQPPALNALTAEEKAAGWKLLFDGRTMTGWDDPSRKTPPGDSWVIEDGCLKSVLRPRIREPLVTTGAFGDFELVFDWRISQRGNSGVKYRIQDQALLEQGKLDPNARRFEDVVDYELRRRLGHRDRIAPNVRVQEYLIGFEYQLIDDHGHPDAKRGANRTSGAIYGLVAPRRSMARPVGQFNHSRIVLRGNHVEHWLNGVKVVEAELNSKEIAAGLAKRWTTSSRVYELLTQQPHKVTPIALQHHNDEAWFRNLKIRPLPPQR